MDITAIAIVGIIAWTIVSITGATKDKRAAKKNSYQSDELTKEVAALKERVSVLEKIVTDEKYDLKKQFDALEKDRVA